MCLPHIHRLHGQIQSCKPQNTHAQCTLRSSNGLEFPLCSTAPQIEGFGRTKGKNEHAFTDPLLASASILLLTRSHLGTGCGAGPSSEPFPAHFSLQFYVKAVCYQCPSQNSGSASVSGPMSMETSGFLVAFQCISANG